MSDSESEKIDRDESGHGIFDWDSNSMKRWDKLREAELRKGFSVDATRKNKASVFAQFSSRDMVVYGNIIALLTIIGTVVSCLFFESDLQGLIYPFISETARDMPQTGAFAFGLTITSMFMVICAVLQYGKVKRDLRDADVGTKRNITGLILGIVAPPFLGLLACYDTKRALNTHRVCVVIFFGLTMIYMLLILSIYHHLAGRNTLQEVMEAYKKDDDGRTYREKRHRSCTPSPKVGLICSLTLTQLLLTRTNFSFFFFVIFYIVIFYIVINLIIVFFIVIFVIDIG